MASYRAIGATCEGIMRLLQQFWRPELFDGAELQFKVYRSKTFETPMDTGVSLFLYRVLVNGVQRTPPARPKPGGQPRRTQLPLDLHFMLTAWAKDASLEHEILGWLMRTLEDSPTLPAGLLNTAIPNIFEPDEQVQIINGELANDEMFRIWEALPASYQMSVPYVARIVRIDSEIDRREVGPVLTRELGFGALKDA